MKEILKYWGIENVGSVVLKLSSITVWLMQIAIQGVWGIFRFNFCHIQIGTTTPREPCKHSDPEAQELSYAALTSKSTDTIMDELNSI